MPFSLYLQQSAVSNAQVKQYASTAQLFDMVKWTKEAYNHFGVPYFDTCCQAEPFNLDPFMPFLISAQAGNNIIVSSLDGKLWAPQVSGTVYATGTTNYIAKFQGSTSLINSTLFEYITVSGTTIIVNGTTSQKVAMQDDGVIANLLVPNFTTSNVSGYSAISSQVIDGTRNRRVAQFLNDTLSLWGHSVIYSTGTIPTYGIWQGINRTLSIAPTGNVIIRTSNTTSDFTDTGYKLDVFGSLRTNSTVNLTGIANTTTANTLYYNSSTGAVTYGAAPSGTTAPANPIYYLANVNQNFSGGGTKIAGTISGSSSNFEFTPVSGKSYSVKITLLTFDQATENSPTAPGFALGLISNSVFLNADCTITARSAYKGYEFASYTDSSGSFAPFFTTDATVSGSTCGYNQSRIEITANFYTCTSVVNSVSVLISPKNFGVGAVTLAAGTMIVTQLN